MRRFLAMVLLGALLGGAVLAQDGRAIIDPQTLVRYRVEQFIPANFPVGMAFAPDGSLFYNEKTTGSVRRVLPDGTLQRAPVVTLPTNALQERGMLGLALAPDFAESQTIYVVHTREGTARDWPANNLVRLRLEEGLAIEQEVLLSVPITNGQLMHNGGNIHFDSEGHLFFSLGDYSEAAHAQDLSTPQGAIHRFIVTEEGLLPAPGNPFGEANSIWAYGLRNPFDFTIDPFSNALFVAEVGPSCDDEINRVLPGMNYGWGVDYRCVGTDPIEGLADYMPPLLSFTPVIAPTGIIVYDHPAIPEWEGYLFFCDWIFGEMQRVVLNDERDAVLAVFPVDLGGVQCRIDLVIGPEGALYFGTVGSGGGAIMRLVPMPF